VLVGEAVPDRCDGDLRVRCDHRVDVAMEAAQGGGLAADLLALRRIAGGERFEDGAAPDVVPALDRPPGHAVAGVAADSGVLRPPGGVVAPDVFFGISPCARPEVGGRQLGQGVQDSGQLAAGERGAEGLLDRCRFVLAPAGQLAAVADASVDAVTTRSVLIYVKDKAQAMREFFRVLRVGGRASLYEPVNVLMSAADPDLFAGYDVTPVKALAARVKALYASIQPPGTDPMLDFDERDLVRHAQDAGFSEISLELRVSVKNHKDPMPWEQFVRMSGNPLLPPLQETLEQVLSTQEAGELARHLRPLVESGTGRERTAQAYLTAVKD
jgi:SAM-dependent methyltransferase